jgi:hypothetical protein
VGTFVGLFVGGFVGALALGALVGTFVGAFVGAFVLGALVGTSVGALVSGTYVVFVGNGVWAAVVGGRVVVGEKVGNCVTTGVGAGVGWFVVTAATGREDGTVGVGISPPLFGIAVGVVAPALPLADGGGDTEGESVNVASATLGIVEKESIIDGARVIVGIVAPPTTTLMGGGVKDGASGLNN